MISETNLIRLFQAERLCWTRHLPYTPYIGGIIKGIQLCTAILLRMPRYDWNRSVVGKPKPSIKDQAAQSRLGLSRADK